MKYYHNVYTYPDGEFKGKTNDEYYAKGKNQVLCLYIPYATDEKIEINLSIYNKAWKFEKEITKEEYNRQLIISSFSGGIMKNMIKFLGEK